jgi:hypothetical protein
MGNGDQDNAAQVGKGRKRRSRRQDDDLKVSMVVEYTEPGSALDEQLRREQARAIFDLVKATRRARGGDS